MARRSKPMVVAPFIPLLGIIGIVGVDRLANTPYRTAFVVVWIVLFSGLFIYVASKMLEARRLRRR